MTSPTIVLYSNTLQGKYVLVRGYDLSVGPPTSIEYLYDHTLPMYDYIEKNNRKNIKIMALGVGHHEIEYDGTHFHIVVSWPDNRPIREYHHSTLIYEIHLSVVGFPEPKEAQERLVSFVEHCKKAVEDKMENYSKDAGKVIKKYIFDPADGGNWTILNIAHKRPLASIFLPKVQLDELVEQVQSFVKEGTREEYARFNIPYKMNVLLYGLPGTGKTSCIHAIASEIDSGIGIIHFGRGVDDTMLTKAINQINNLEKCRVLVFEDIDSLFSDERKAHDSSKNAITLSGLLNCLDGLSRSEGLILFMTTNRRDILEDVALLRSCRIDMEMEFKDATTDQIAQMIQYYFPEHATAAAAAGSTATDTIETLASKNLTTATLQQYFFQQRHCDNIYALPNFKIFLNRFRNHPDKSKPGMYM
jgi:DNA replication protein DnaC